MYKGKTVITGLGIKIGDIDEKEEFKKIIDDDNEVFKFTEVQEKINDKKINRKAGLINEVSISEIKPIVLRQIDIASKIGIKSALVSLKDSKLDNEKYEKMGIFMGTEFGGATFAEDECEKFIDNGYKKLSPYLTISMFFSAVIGQLSIYTHAEGFCKTFCAGECSSIIAIGQAYESIVEEKNELAIAGGYEKANTKKTSITYYFSNNLDMNIGSKVNYEKVLTDGAGTLVLEKEEDVQKRNAKVYGYIRGYRQGFSRKNNKELLNVLIEDVLKSAGISKSDIGYIDYNMFNSNKEEVGNLREIVGNDIKIGNLSYKVGNTIGATGSIQCISSLLSKSIENGCLILIITRSIEGNITILFMEKV